MLTTTTTTAGRSHKRVERERRMIEKLEEIIVREHSPVNNGNDYCETNSKASASMGKCHSDRRRRASVASGNVPQRRIGITKSFSSRGFLPLENDGGDDREQQQQQQQQIFAKSLTKEFASNSTISVVTTPSTVASTLLSSSKSYFESPILPKIVPMKEGNVVDHSAAPPPPLPPRRAKSGSFTAQKRRSSGDGCVSAASPSVNATAIEELEDEVDRLNAELTRVQHSQEQIQQRKLRAGTSYQQLQDEFDALQKDVLLKLDQIEGFESENDRLQEECLHYETQVFSMTKSLDACVTKRDEKNEEYNLVHQEWARMHLLGSDLLQALHEYHTAASSPDHVDLELHFRHQQELLDEMQEEVCQLREEVRSYHYEQQPITTHTAAGGASILIIPDPPQSRSCILSTSPKRNCSILSQGVGSPSSRSSGSSQSCRCDKDPSNQGTSKERRKVAAQELRQDLQHRRHRRSSLTSNDCR